MLIGANLILNDTTLPMREVAPLVEEYGLDALFLGEHTHTPVATVHPQYPGGLPEFYKRFLDPFVQLAVAAAVTERVRIGTGVLLVAERNPLELAKAVASLDVVSGGRVEVGVGLGWNTLEMVNNGIDPKRRRAIFREKLAVLRRLWTEDVVGVDGEFVRFTDSWVYPKPLQKPHPPDPDRRCRDPGDLRRRRQPRRRVVPARLPRPAREGGGADRAGRRRPAAGDRRRDGGPTARQDVVHRRRRPCWPS